jgi:HK97 gp10 family phage protein
MATVAASAEIAQLAKDLSAASGDSIERSAAQLIADGAQRIAAEARALAPVKTGKLQSSIHARWLNPMRVEIGPEVIYGPYQEFGTGSRGEFPGTPYEIKPKKPGGKLVFTKDGKTIVTRRVIHPGVRPQPYMRPAFEKVLKDVMERLASSGSASITRGPNAT